MAPTVLLLAAAMAAAPAASDARRVELVPLLGVRGGLDLEADAPGIPPEESDPSASIGLAVIVPLREDGWFQASLDHQSLSFPGFDMAVDYLQFGGGYQPGEGSVRPFVSATLGLTRYGADPGSVDNTIGLSGSLGGGFSVPMGRRLSFRLEVLGYATATDAAVSVGCGPGCFVHFGASGWYQLAARAGLAIRL